MGEEPLGVAQERAAGLDPARLVIMSVGFGLQHAVLPLVDWRTSLSRTLAMFLVGIVFGVLYLKLKRLVPLIVGHWALDFLFLGLFPLFSVLAAR